MALVPQLAYVRGRQGVAATSEKLLSVDAYFYGRSVLVTGGAGVIGVHLVSRLVRSGARVTVIDDLSAGPADGLAGIDCNLIVSSIDDESGLQRAFCEAPSIVFHLAALFANEKSIEHPERDLLTNGFGTLRLLIRASQAKVDRFVYTSSSGVYGDRAEGYCREADASLQLATPYQVTKLLGELYANCFHTLQSLPTVNVRLFNVYGPGELPRRYRNVIPNFIARALAGRPLELHGDGNQTRDFTYVGDAVQGLLLCAAAPAAAGRTFNLGSGQEVRVRVLAETITQLCGGTAGIVSRPFRHWDRVLRRCADISLAQQVLGFCPRWSLHTGLEETIAWFRAHPGRWQTHDG